MTLFTAVALFLFMVLSILWVTGTILFEIERRKMKREREQRIPGASQR